MNDEVCFWHEYKNQSLLQVDTIIIGICNQAYPKYPQKVCISLEYLQKSLEIKFNFCLQRNTKAFYKLIVWLWVCIPRHPQSTQTTMLQYFCNISRKTSRMKYIFGLVVNARGFFKLIQLFNVCVAGHAQITQNSKFAISQQYLKKQVSDEADFSCADKHESLLQINAMILMRMVKHF